MISTTKAPQDMSQDSRLSQHPGLENSDEEAFLISVSRSRDCAHQYDSRIASIVLFITMLGCAVVTRGNLLEYGLTSL